jgi:release factor glutamine methyltransferase
LARGDSCLEIGAGIGSNLAGLAGRFQILAGTDLFLPDDLKDTLRLNCNILNADRACPFRDSVFDLVIFNPPYLPSDGFRDVAIDGGAGGIEVPLLFLSEALRVMKPSGRILLVLSSESDLTRFSAVMPKGVQLSQVDSESLFYEKLFLFEVRRQR